MLVNNVARVYAPRPAPAPSGWTDERVARLREMWADGLSAREIAGELGTTKNAVIGKMGRLRLEARRPGPTHQSQRKPRGRVEVRPGRSSTYGGEVRMVTPPPPLPKSGDDPLPTSRMLTIHELDMATQCRWPLGTPHTAAFRYCGADREHPGNDAAHCYCETHWRLSRRIQH